MYARITTYRCDPSRLDDLTAKLDEIKAQVKAISGVVDVYSAWRADGNGVTAAIYESQATAEAAASQVQVIWANLAGQADVARRWPKLPFIANTGSPMHAFVV